MNRPPNDDRATERSFVADVLRAEADAVSGLIDRLGSELHQALDVLEACMKAGGSVIVTGMGKSGLIGRKISATLASLGVPSHDMHPAEAVHGDLGRVRAVDAVLALSNSGETEELVTLAAILRQDSVPIISITGGDGSSALARLATVSLSLGQITEASDLGLAPTCSTTGTLALGDALALALARRLMVTPDEFARRHPGGTLGGLLRPITDILRFSVGHNLPVVQDDMSVRDALHAADALGRRPGALIVVDARGSISGIFTDGDFRRLFLHEPDLLESPIRSVMTKSPRVLQDTDLVRDAVRLVREHRADEIPVVDGEGRPVGLLDVQDLIALRVVRDDASR
ncbi:MAG: KpsF/GutQ family sugar-phosphate isomerase [Planctomycetota bacterium]